MRVVAVLRAAHLEIELVMRGQTYANVALARVADGSLDLGFVRLTHRGDSAPMASPRTPHPHDRVPTVH